MNRLRVAWLPDGKRLHLYHDPIDLIIQAFGRPAEVGRAYDAGIARARALLPELREDVQRLKAGALPQGPAGQRALAACAAVPGGPPAVAVLHGAIADEMLAAMVQAGQLERGFVNNRGAVSFHLAEGQSLTPQSMDWPAYHRFDVQLPVSAATRTRGLTAAGWAYDGMALGWVNRIHVAAGSATMAASCLAGIATRMLPLEGGQTLTAVPQSPLEDIPLYAPVPDMARDEAAAILAQGREVAEQLFAGSVITLAAMELGEQYCLVAPPNYSLKSIIMGLDG
ncbi:MAG TPA: hypothetical protein VEQ16_02745 [Acidocella sp.]|nr:hypothetical protein [Acidocella sp.]